MSAAHYATERKKIEHLWERWIYWNHFVFLGFPLVLCPGCECASTKQEWN